MKRILRFTLLSIFLFNFEQFNAQDLYRTWYFGDRAGIQFNVDNSVSVLTDGLMNSSEGNSTIVDASGNLLFYTNGKNIWNANHEIMDNGSGLLGSNKSMQNFIVKQPGNANLYYVFTSSDWTGSTNHLRYTIVDMDLDGGLGSVIQKNTILLNDVFEHISATHHTNGTDLWIVSHAKEGTQFYAYLLNASGIGSPVTSNNGDIVYTGKNRHGVIKFTRDGTRMVSTLGKTGQVPIELYDFNKTTGQLTNPMAVLPAGTWYDVIGSEFSPNGTKLYITEWANVSGYGVTQFDISLATPELIQASETKVFNGSDRQGIQIGPDKKIYVTHANQPYLDVINNPNEAGAACGYVAHQINLQGRNGKKCLQNTISSFIDAQTCPISFEGDILNDICEDNTKDLSSVSPSGGVWSEITSSGSISGNTYTPANVSVVTPITLRYTYNLDGCTETKDLDFNVNPAPTGITNTTPSSDLCDNSTRVLTGSPTGGTFEIINGGGSIVGNTYSPPLVSTSTNVTIQYSMSCGASDYTDNVSFNVLPSPEDPNATSSSIQFCTGSSVTLHITGESGASYSWTGPSGFTSAAEDPLVDPAQGGTYTVVQTAANGCSSGSVSIELNESAAGYVLAEVIASFVDEPTCIRPADFDNDGDLDVVIDVANATNVYFNQGDGTFSTPINLGTVGARFTMTADVDSDGYTDVVAGSIFYPTELVWYKNNGNGTFSSKNVVGTAGYVTTIVAADFTGDGHIDLATNHSNNDEIYWFENDGSNGFGPKQIVTTAVDMPVSIDTGDFDNDGDLDLVSVSRNDHKVAWYENDGLGNFGAQQIISSVYRGPQYVHVKDVDSDGNLDLLIASWSSDKISWFPNTGGSFGSENIISTGVNGANQVHGSDLDGDGDIDVVSMSQHDDKLSWYENLGSGTFGSRNNISVDDIHYQSSVYTGDMDLDGKMDILASNWMNDSAAWYHMALGEPPVTTSENNDSISVCLGTNLILDIDTIPGSSYSWSGPNGFTSTDPNPVINNIAVSDTGVYVFTQNAGGCLVYITNLHVNVSSLSVPDVTTSLQNECPDTTIDLTTLLNSNPEGVFVFKNSSNQTVSNPYAVGSGTYTVIDSVSPTCLSSPSSVITITINSCICIPPSNTGATSYEVCEGGSVQFLIDGTSGATYDWSGPNGFTSALEDPTIAVVSSADSGNYYVVQELNGCYSDPLEIPLSVNSPISSAGTIGSSQSNCGSFDPPPFTSIQDPSGGAGGTFQYSWQSSPTGTGSWSTISGETSSTYDAPLVNATTYYRRRARRSSCGSWVNSNIINLTIDSDPGIANNTTNPSNICEYNTKILTATPIGGTWSIISGGGSISNSIYTPLNVLNDTNVSIRYSVSSSGSCPASSDDVSFTVIAKPDRPTVSLDVSNVCPDATVDLTSHVLSAPQGVIIYRSGFNNSTIPDPTAVGSGSFNIFDSIPTPEGCVSDFNQIETNITPCTCSSPPGISLSSTNSIQCNLDPMTVSGNTFSGSATQVNLSHNGLGSLNITNTNTSPFAFTYTPVLADQGDTITITLVTDNPNGSPCTSSTEHYTLIINAPVTANAGSDATTTCTTPTATLTASGGGSYAWSNGSNSASITVNPAATTTYTVTVTAANGCTDTDDATVTVNKTTPTANAGSDATTTCTTPSATLTASGGGSYAWSNGSNTASITVNPASTTTYTVTVTAANGCTDTDDAIVTVNKTAPTANAGSDATTTCTTPSATLTASGGGSYAWSNGSNTASITVNPASTTTYTVTVTAANGCTDTDDAIVIVNKTAPTANAGSDATTTCTTPTATLTASGGGSYAWSNGSNTASITVNPASTTTYTVTVTAANGCTDTDDAIVTVNKTAPTANAGSDATTTCTTPSATLTASGGGSYAWSNGSNTASITVNPASTTTYTVTVTAANGCTDTDDAIVTVNKTAPTANAGSDATTTCTTPTATLTASGGGSYAWSNGSNTASITVNPASTTTYTVTVTAANGCTDTDDAIVTVNKTAPTANAGSDATTTCTTPTATLTASGGGSYAWSNGSNTASITVNPASTTTYTVTVTAANGCTDTDDAIVTVNKTAPTANAGSDATTTCTTPSATLTAIGGGSYAWSNGSNTPSITVNPASTTTYTVTVTAANGCTDTDDAIVTVNKTAPTANAGSDATTTCTTPTATLTASGGGSYAWSNGSNTASITVNPASTTTYTVTVTAANGCTDTDDAIVTVNKTAPTADAGSDATTTCTTPTATLTASGGGSYAWSNGSNSASITVNPAATTTYTVTVTAANGCTDTDNATVTVNKTAPTANAGSDATTTCTTPSATLTASGGGSYAWSNGAGSTSSVTVNPASTTTYTVTVTAANGCTDTDDAIVTVNKTAPTADAGSDATTTCTTPTATLTASGGGSYAWSNGSNTASITVNPASTTTYTVTVTAANGCTDTDDAIVTVNKTASTANAGSDATTTCTTPTATLTASGGGSYAWSNGSNTASITVNPASTTTYTVTVTAANGCTDTDDAIVTVNKTAPTADAGSDATTTCTTPTATLTASGGGSYAWSNGSNTASITVNPASTTTYTVTVTAANGCTDTDDAIVTVNKTASTANAGSDATTTCTTPTATLTASGGGSYAWSNGSNTASITVNPASTTTYTVTVTAANGCTDTDDAIVTVNKTAPTANAGSDATTTCTTPTATLTASGGGSYAWSNGSNTASITVNPASTTTYTVTVTAANGCTDTDDAIVTVNKTAPTASNTKIDVACFSQNTGSIDASVNTGSGSYTYLWSNGELTQDISSLSVGSYTLTITDTDNGCTVNTSANISGPASGLSSSTTGSNITTIGGTDGTATTTPTGGTPPYTYLWDNASNSTTATINNLPAGTYNVTITDANGCTTSGTITLSDPSCSFSVDIFDPGQVSCFAGSDGTATVTESGGTAPFTYAWSNSATTATVSSLTEGTYGVTVTDNVGCVASTSTTITQPASAASVNISSSTNVSCHSGNDGNATSLASGGVAPYTYLWSTGATTAGISNLTEGTYTLTITDANNCTANTSAIITEPASPLSTTTTGNNITTVNGTDGDATTTPSGGTAPYAYLWDNASASTTATINNLPAGTYNVTVTDANGCTTTDNITLSDPSCAFSASISSSTNVSCHAGNNGSATVSLTGGTAPFTYSWSNSATTATASSLVAGTYSVTITDNVGCIATSSVTITEPSPLAINMNASTQVSCNGKDDGFASISLTGGTAPYTYSWNTSSTSDSIFGLTAGTYAVTATDVLGCTISSSTVITDPSLINTILNTYSPILCHGDSSGSIGIRVLYGGTPPYSSVEWYKNDTLPINLLPSNVTGNDSLTASNLSAGMYILKLEDANGCTLLDTQNINGPSNSVLSTTTTGNNITTINGTDGDATTTPSGGTTPYTYLWDNASASTTATINNLPAGTYNVTVTDANGCTTTDNITLSDPSCSFSASISSSTNVSCNAGNNGEATVSLTGGTSPFTYAWSNSATTATASSLVAGTYSVTITDNVGCIASASTTITEPASPLSTTTTGNNITTINGTDGDATTTPSGGTTPYTYLWDNASASTTATINNLPAGTYNVTITDANGCTTTDNITLSDPSCSFSASISSSTNVSCNAGNNGEATVSLTGGTAPFTYAWSNSATTATASNLTAGTYGVTITDNVGCIASASTTITEPASPLSTTTTGNNITTINGTDGDATTTPSGGTTPYTYLWDNASASTTATINNLPAGTYNVTVTDANGCTTTDNITLSDPSCSFSASISSSTNVSCNAGNNGEATVNLTGGTSPFTYAWSNSATTATASSLVAGTYSVTITDNVGCIASASTTITEPASPLSTTTTGNNITTINGTDGDATTTPSGGTSPYTYLWDNASASTTATINNLPAGTYNVTVTDANGCTTTDNITLSDPSCSFSASISSSTNVSCNAGNNGEATVSLTGGTSPFTYAWSNSATTATASSLVAGTYSVTITDNVGCIASASTTITEPASPLSTTTTGNNITTINGTDGDATTTPSGGTTPYTYLWDNASASTTATINNLPAGTYNVTITDANGCTTTDNITLSDPSCSFSASISSSTNVSCNAGNNGEATVSLTGGTAPFTYAWSNSATTATASSLVAGTYSVTITDNVGCIASASTTITEPASPLSTTTTGNNITTINGTDGDATTTPSGGTTPYTYLWDNASASTTATINNLPAGTYNVTVTDANGCTTTDNITLSDPSCSFSASISSSTNVSCNAGNNGEATVSLTGGTSPFTYAWSNSATTATASSLVAGTYSVTITDNVGCIASASTTITEPASPLSTTTTGNNITTINGTDGDATTTPSGGTTPYTYLWDNASASTTATINNLPAGTYNVTVTDANGCTTTDNITLSDPSCSFSASISSSTNVSCNAGNNGEATVSLTGGTSPFTYAWSNSATTATASSLVAGTYSVTITDNVGCIASASTTITEPASPLSTTTTGNNITTINGTDGDATTTPSGGTSPYTYLWDNASASTTATINNLPAGTYNVTITDANGCTTTDNITLSDPSCSFSASISSSTNVSCNAGNNGEATVSLTGGTAPFTYAWSNSATTATASSLVAGTYSVTITDNVGCIASASTTITEPASPLSTTTTGNNITTINGTDGDATTTPSGGTTPYTYLWDNASASTTATINNLPAGTYNVTVTDANGCTTTDNITLSDPSCSFSASISSSTNVSCNAGNNGEATVSLTGGTAPFTYAWSNSATTATASSLVAGTYSVTITDNVGCIASASTTITEPASPLSTTTTGNNITTINGTDGDATTTPSGGTTPYTYLWDNASASTTATINNLPAGTYNVTITDANGCTTTDNITLSDPSCAFSASISSSTNVSCNAGNNGEATVSLTGGTAPFTYAWSNSATTATASSLVAGTYSVTITDNVGCIASASTTITEPASPLSTTTTGNNITTINGTDGDATTTPSGGTSPYTYLWDNASASTTATINNLPAGTYNVTITDANGCTTTDNITLSDPSCAFSASISSSTNVSCNAGNNGEATVSLTGGTAPFTYAWSNSATTATASNLTAGTYSVTITDNVGCIASASTTITEPATAASVSITSSTNVNCHLGNDGNATSLASGGVAPYTYLWNTGATTAGISNLTEGTYTLTITDVNNCTANTSVTISEPIQDLMVSIDNQTNVNCNAGNDGSITTQTSGGTAAYTYLWSSGQTSSDISSLTANTYTVTVTDANNCTASTQATITQPANALSTSTSGTDATTVAAADGTATTTPLGGTTPYTYLWDNASASTTATINNLPAGTYNVTVTDANGCTTTDMVTITEPQCLGYSASITSTSQVSCYDSSDASLTVTAVGGATPITYLWSNTQTTQTITGLSPATYSVTVTDNLNCADTITGITITQPSALTLSITSTDALCNGAASGSLTALPAGGTLPYSYNWSHGATDSTLSASSASYTLSLTDANNCETTATAQVNQPGSMSVSGFSSTPSCYGYSDGAASALVIEGTAPYSYTWEQSATSQGTETSDPGSQAFGGSSTMENLPSGTYSITVSDANSCSYTLPITINQAVLLEVVNLSIIPEDCGLENGSITDSAFGGRAPYTYSWLNNPSTSPVANNLMGQVDTLIVTDVNGCVTKLGTDLPANYTANLYGSLPQSGYICELDSTTLQVNSNGTITSYQWSTNETTDSITIAPLATENTYSVTISNGRCTAQDNISLDIKPLPVLTLSGDTVLCDSAQGSLTANATTNIVTYQWNTGDSTQTIQYNAATAPAQIMVTVTDNFGCEASNETAPVRLTIHPKPTANFDTLPRGAYRDEVAFVDSSYDNILFWEWDFGDGWTTDLQNPRHLYTAAGTYETILTVQNQFGCMDTASILIEIIEYIEIPNVFTPNGDGFNDEFRIPSSGIGEFELVIKNRWGEQVFSSTSNRLVWDGTSQSGVELPQGQYYYILKAIGSQDYSRQGGVTLLRD